MKRLFACVLLAAGAVSALGQAISTNGGSIQGTITDPSGAAIPGAQVTISSTDTGYSHALKADSAGFYSVGPLNPGNYTIQVSSPNFQQLKVQTVVRVGIVTSGNERLSVGNQSETVEVNAGAVQVNTEQAGVTDVITRQQIDSLPVNGRNILDFAQLQPGVQLQAGGSNDGGFDPTKAGYSALSFNGVSGRTTRILLDGQDVTDETVGTTIFNISEGSVGEINVSRATNDVSGDITSSGSVLMSTRSGTNNIHGSLFYNFQDQRVGAATYQGVSNPFQRNQFGGSVGGPIIKDKLFFFANSERFKQDQSAPINLNPEFSAIQALHPNVGSPDRDTYSAGRLDYNGPWSTHMFVRVNYEANSFATGSVYSTYANRDNAPGIAGGLDLARGNLTHSFRVSYEKFHNLIADTTSGNSSIYNPIPGYGIENVDGSGIQTGPNDNAPQQTFQSDKQVRYDGSWVRGRHSIRFGASLNRIQGGGLAAFFGYGPLAIEYGGTALDNCATTGNDQCDPAADFAPYEIYISNDLGYASEKPAFGFPGGGQADWRTGIYLVDAWKIRPSFTLTIGARYDHDTGRTNSDVPPIPCSSIVTANFNFPASGPPCTGNTPLLDQWGPGVGGRVAQPQRNVGPQIGFTYAPEALHNKTVFRGGFGIFFESNVFNNVQFDRAGRLQTGEFASYPTICANGYTYPINGQLVTQTSTGVSIQTICNESIAAGAAAVLQLQADARAGGASAAANQDFIGNSLYTPGGVDMYAANYQSPYSENVNFGMQQELMRGMVLSADYIHLGTFRISQTIDANHVGDSRFFDKAAAQAAIANTLAACGAASIDAALAPAGCPGLHPARNGNPAGSASISDFAAKGLDSGVSVNGGAPSTIGGGTPAAFPGANPNVGVGTFAFPQGKAGYDGLQLSLKYQAVRPLPGLMQTNFIASYAYSRSQSDTSENGISTSDPFFAPPSYNNRSPGSIIGYDGLDRTHIFSFGGAAQVKYGLKVGLIAHFDSAVPTNMRIDAQGSAPGEIFRSDVDGDGQTGDLMPSTRPGDYMRHVKPGNLNQVISNYNNTEAGQLTPAGQDLVNAGLFTAQQMIAANAVQPTLALAPSTPYANPPLRTLDMNFSYPITLKRFHEGLSIEPGVAIYNIANFANYDALSDQSSGTVMTAADVTTGNVNGPGDYDARNSQRVSRRTGTFDQGAPRATEFQLKVNF